MCSILQVQQWCELRWDTSTRKLTCKLCRLAQVLNCNSKLFLKKMSTIYNLASITFLKGTYQKVHAQAMLCKVGAKWLQFSVTHPSPPLPPPHRWDAGPSKVTLKYFVNFPWQFASTHLILLGGQRHCGNLPRNTTQWPGHVPNHVESGVQPF